MRVRPAHIPTEFYLALARNIIKQACLDAAGAGNVTKKEQEAAADWLTSADCVWYCEVTGLDAAALRRWVRAGCPYNRQEINKIRRINRQQPDND